MTEKVTALRFDWLTRFYDPFLGVTLKEDKVKRRLVEQVGLRPGHRALDVGCGTATLTDDIGSGVPGGRGAVSASFDRVVSSLGRAGGALMRVAFLQVQLLDGFRSTSDNVRGRLPELISEAGFSGVEETHRERTIFGVLSLYRAKRL